jgi:hypothetical protein
MVLLFLLVAGVVFLLLPPTRAWISEQAKDVSDRAVSFMLRGGSEFGKELTRDGEMEQEMWRQQRLRDLRNRRLRSRVQ